MADINVTCKQCGKSSTISEYAASDTARCNSCGALLTMPALAKDAGGLRVREMVARQPQALGDPSEPVTSAAVSDPGGADTLAHVYKAREKEKSPRTLLGWLIFLALLAGLVVMQRAIADEAPILESYTWIRAVLGGLVYLLIILLAFEDSLGHGLVSLLFPPYAFYYALARVDTYWVRSLFMALFLGMCTELYFIRDESAIIKAQKGFNDMIHGGEQVIQRAGEAPTFEPNHKKLQPAPSAPAKRRSY